MLTDYRLLHLDVSTVMVDEVECPAPRATGSFRQGLKSLVHELRTVRVSDGGWLSIASMCPLLEASEWLPEIDRLVAGLGISSTSALEQDADT